MLINMAKILEKYGLERGIERHNFIIKYLIKSQIHSFNYSGLTLDLGCGNCPYKDVIRQTAESYIGVDWNNSPHDKSKLDVIANISLQFPFKNNIIDTVVSFYVLEHLCDPRKFIEECYRILKADGKLFLTAPLTWHIHEAPHDYFRFTRHGLEYLLKQAGFSDINIIEYGCFWLSWINMFNYYTSKFAKGPFKYGWYILWWITQQIAMFLNNRSKIPSREYAMYYRVEARK